MDAKTFLESKGIKPVKKLIDGTETGEYLITVDVMNDYLKQMLAEKTIFHADCNGCTYFDHYKTFHDIPF